MPVPPGTRYRWKKMKSGKKVRLAFAPGSSKVIEAKSRAHVMRDYAKKRARKHGGLGRG